MNALYDLDSRHNCEIRNSWFLLCIKAGERCGSVGVGGDLSPKGGAA